MFLFLFHYILHYLFICCFQHKHIQIVHIHSNKIPNAIDEILIKFIGSDFDNIVSDIFDTQIVITFTSDFNTIGGDVGDVLINLIVC